MIRCQYSKHCQKPAVVQNPYKRRKLCKQHFLKNIENRVRKTIKKEQLINFKNPNEKILVTISGGKDSQTLLTILHRVINNRIPLEALYIEVGISPKNYSQDSAKIAQQLCEQLKVPYNELNILDHIRMNMDQIHQLGMHLSKKKTRKKNKLFRGDCSYCGLFKRYFINYFAVKNKFTKVATGHNLTDEATQLFSNFSVGDIELMSRAGPSTAKNVEGLIDRIKPLYYIYESELILYSFHANVPHLATECEYATDSPMISMKSALQEIEDIQPGALMRMVLGFQDKLRDFFYNKTPEEKKIIKKCQVCGMTTYLEVCSFCKTIDSIRTKFNRQGIHQHP